MNNPIRMAWSRSRNAIRSFDPVNWPQTIYFNFKFFPFSIARKFPVVFYRRVKIMGFAGNIVINGPVKRGMMSFGKPFERFSRSMGIAEIGIDGTLVLNGRSRFSMDCLLYVGEGASLEIGDRFRMGARSKLICTKHITISNDVGLSYESQLVDSNFHSLINTETREVYPMSRPVRIGAYNFIGNRSSIQPGTITPDYCTVSSNSVCTRDYSTLGENIVIGGVPAKLVKSNTTRDWEGEKEQRENYL